MQNFREKYAYKISLNLIIFPGIVLIVAWGLFFLKSIEIFKNIPFVDFYFDIIFFISLFLCVLSLFSSLILRFLSQDVQKHWWDIISLLLGYSLIIIVKITGLFCVDKFQGDMGVRVCPGAIETIHRFYYSVSVLNNVLKILPVFGFIVCIALAVKYLTEFKRRNI